jgi:hypothetical protein
VQRGGGANATTGAGTERTQWLLLVDALKKRSATSSLAYHLCLAPIRDASLFRRLRLEPCNPGVAVVWSQQLTHDH